MRYDPIQSVKDAPPLMLNRIAACALLLACAASLARAQSIPVFTISTVAGNGTAGYSGDGGQATNAALTGVAGVAVDSNGNLYFSDDISLVRKVAPDGTISTFAGSLTPGYGGDGGPAKAALLNAPFRICTDAQNNLYIADNGNNRIRKVTPDGLITVVAGNGVQGYSGDGGLAVQASLNRPQDVIVDASGNIFIADYNNYVVRKVDTNGIITTVAGNGIFAYSGDGGPATSASIDGPSGIAVDANSNLFIATVDNRIRKVANGIITTVAGTGGIGYSGDGGPAKQATFSHPSCLRTDTAGNLYIDDRDNNAVRLVVVDGTIWTVAGNGTAGFGGDGGPATAATIDSPRGVAISSSGAVYIGDTLNYRVRLLAPIPSISASSIVSASAFGEFTSVAPGSWIEIYGSNLAADTRGWTGADFTGINAPTSLDGTYVTIGGQKAFVDYISPTQVNALIPSNVLTGTQQLTVTSPGGTTSSVNVTVNPVEPGLLAPPNFKIGGTQFVVAQFADGTYVLPLGAVAGLTGRPAVPGDILVIYGIGFGPVTPDISAGQLVGEANSLATDFHILIGGVECQVQYDGLAPSYTGLYQLNVVVPNVASGNQPLTLTVDGVNGTQTLFVAIGN
jgi:uncharacterized protein (TIGR03437 family)